MATLTERWLPVSSLFRMTVITAQANEAAGVILKLHPRAGTLWGWLLPAFQPRRKGMNIIVKNKSANY